MANQPTKQPQYQLEFSSICASDFGLKVGLWTREGGDEMEFREVLGWITVVVREVFERASQKRPGRSARRHQLSHGCEGPSPEVGDAEERRRSCAAEHE